MARIENIGPKNLLLQVLDEKGFPVHARGKWRETARVRPCWAHMKKAPVAPLYHCGTCWSGRYFLAHLDSFLILTDLLRRQFNIQCGGGCFYRAIHQVVGYIHAWRRIRVRADL